MNSRPKEPTRVSARALARRAPAEATAVATGLSIKGVVAGAAVEETQASESASTLEEQQAEVSLNFEEFEATSTTTKTAVVVGSQAKGYSIAACI